MVASILKIGISQNLICDNLVSFPKSGHKYNYMYCYLLIYEHLLTQIVAALIYMYVETTLKATYI